MREPMYPMKLQRKLRLYLVDLQLADDPHADLIAQVYARLVELENLTSILTVLPVTNNYTDLANRAGQSAGGGRA